MVWELREENIWVKESKISHHWPHLMHEVKFLTYLKFSFIWDNLLFNQHLISSLFCVITFGVKCAQNRKWNISGLCFGHIFVSFWSEIILESCDLWTPAIAKYVFRTLQRWSQRIENWRKVRKFGHCISCSLLQARFLSTYRTQKYVYPFNHFIF